MIVGSEILAYLPDLLDERLHSAGIKYNMFLIVVLEKPGRGRWLKRCISHRASVT